MKKIYIYCDEGASAKSVKKTARALKLLSKSYALSSARTLLEDLKSASLLIMPGGRDIPYDRALDGEKTEAIRQFVIEGGGYLGICAGAYFGSSFVDFDRGGSLEVIEERSMKFFSGTAIGPELEKGKFCYDSEKGAKLTPIFFKEKSYSVYYNGGCSFEGGFKETLGIYEETKRPAIIKCLVGNGLVILSGVHIEYEPTQKTLFYEVISYFT